MFHVPRSSVLATCIFAAAVVAPPASADDASCKPVSDAMMKQARTPYHETATAGGKPFEKIYTTTTLYIGSGGHWMNVPATPQTLVDAMHDTGQPFTDCRLLRTEVLEGQATTVYAAHSRTANPAADSDAQIWIADASGLPVKTEADVQENGRKTHASTHLDYTDVRPPAGAK